MRHPAPTQLQIFGERCSGTNFVAQLLRRNLPRLQLTDRYGWKHGFARAIEDGAPECAFVIVTRDPFDWVRSLHRKPWHAGPSLRDRTLSEFLREPWSCEWGRDMQLADRDPRAGTEMMHERDPVTGERFANVMRLRSSKLRDWQALQARVQHHVVVRYEDVLAAPKLFVRDLAKGLAMRRWPWFRAVKTFKGGPERFVKKDYEALAVEDRDWIAQQLDADVELAAGYPLT
ncbi:MAG: hypothetical protein ACI85K_000815 [Hyphomicrobiaceae bacterium]|jgi:hypothetical protein